MTFRNPSKPLEVPNETEMSGAIRILMNKEFEVVQCVSKRVLKRGLSEAIGLLFKWFYSKASKSPRYFKGPQANLFCL